MSGENLRIAVVTGEHDFEADRLAAAFDSMGGIDWTWRDLFDLVADPNAADFDAAVFYNFHQGTPSEETSGALLAMTRRGQGIVLLHHGILAYLDWDEFGRICRAPNRKFGYHPGQRVRVHVEDPQHPIVAGVEDWEMTDETYTIESQPDAHVILTTGHPLSMPAVGWVHEYGASRVFCFQSGHDNRAYRTPEFRRVLAQGIRWVARAE